MVEEAAAGKGGGVRGIASGKRAAEPVSLKQVDLREGERMTTHIAELDRVLGGGLVPGSLTLVGGDPGIGKSTLLLQVCRHMAADGRKLLYISGEESLQQIKMRANRIGEFSDQLLLLCETNLETVEQTIRKQLPAVAVIDSIQTMYREEISSAPGSVSQVRESTNVLMQLAKGLGISILIVGHVTKEGTVAGPRVLEHMVDTVLYFEGDRHASYRILRGVKNRFGSTSEAAIFEMNEKGLAEVENPSATLLAERQNTDGSIILATLDGTRPILVEIQALVTPTTFGYPRRTSSGFDANRLSLLIAVVERRTKLKLSDKDVYINVVGGLKLQDAAADLAICLAMASAAAGRKLSEDYVVFGEVGLGGEVRSAFRPDQRIAEAKKLGFRHAIAPATIKDPFIIPVKDLRSTLIDYVKE